MKLILFFSIFLTFTNSNLVYAGEGCFDSKNSFFTSPPTGWRADYSAGKKLGLCVVYMPIGNFTFENSPAVIYPNLSGAKTDTSGAVNLNEFIQQDEKKFKEASAKVKFSTLPVSKNKSGLSFSLRKAEDGASPNEFELIAYHSAKEAVFIAVLNTQSASNLKKYEPAFTEFLSQVIEVKRLVFYQDLRKIADKTVATKTGKEFETVFMNSIGQLLANSMKDCIKPDDSGFNSVLTISELGEIIEWTNKEDSRFSLCVRNKMKGLKGAKPKLAPFQLPVDISLKP